MRKREYIDHCKQTKQPDYEKAGGTNRATIPTSPRSTTWARPPETMCALPVARLIGARNGTSRNAPTFAELTAEHTVEIERGYKQFVDADEPRGRK